MSLRISVLGPLTISVGGLTLRSRPAGERAVLGLLALRGGDLVPLWSIIDAVWDSEPPASASGIVQSYISRLRRVLGQGVGVAFAEHFRLAGRAAVARTAAGREEVAELLAEASRIVMAIGLTCRSPSN